MLFFSLRCSVKFSNLKSDPSIQWKKDFADLKFSTQEKQEIELQMEQISIEKYNKIKELLKIVENQMNYKIDWFAHQKKLNFQFGQSEFCIMIQQGFAKKTKIHTSPGLLKLGNEQKEDVFTSQVEEILQIQGKQNKKSNQKLNQKNQAFLKKISSFIDIFKNIKKMMGAYGKILQNKINKNLQVNFYIPGIGKKTSEIIDKNQIKIDQTLLDKKNTIYIPLLNDQLNKIEYKINNNIFLYSSENNKHIKTLEISVKKQNPTFAEIIAKNDYNKTNITGDGKVLFPILLENLYKVLSKEIEENNKKILHDFFLFFMEEISLISPDNTIVQKKEAINDSQNENDEDFIFDWSENNDNLSLRSFSNYSASPLSPQKKNLKKFDSVQLSQTTCNSPVHNQKRSLITQQDQSPKSTKKGLFTHWPFAPKKAEIISNIKNHPLKRSQTLEFSSKENKNSHFATQLQPVRESISSNSNDPLNNENQQQSIAPIQQENTPQKKTAWDIQGNHQTEPYQYAINQNSRFELSGLPIQKNNIGSGLHDSMEYQQKKKKIKKEKKQSKESSPLYVVVIFGFFIITATASLVFFFYNQGE